LIPAFSLSSTEFPKNLTTRAAELSTKGNWSARKANSFIDIDFDFCDSPGGQGKTEGTREGAVSQAHGTIGLDQLLPQVRFSSSISKLWDSDETSRK
jgi:hypothetical protein